MKKVKYLFLCIQSFFFGCACSRGLPGDKVLTKQPNIKQTNIILHVGCFPNVTHAPALIAKNLQRYGKSPFAAYLPPHVQIQWQIFNAGPAAMECFLTNTLELAYVGPMPPCNLYLRSNGRAVRVLSGAVQGGSGLVLQGDLKMDKVQNLTDKRIASPQFGNTQDIACRAWFRAKGLPIGFSKQAVHILPTANPDQNMLFKKKLIDGAWTVEPWLSCLLSEGKGQLYYLDDKNWTTILVASYEFYTQHSDLMKAFVRAHEALLQWISTHIEESIQILQEELKLITKLDFSKELIAESLRRLSFKSELKPEEITIWVQWAQENNYFKALTDAQIHRDLNPLFEFMESPDKKELEKSSTAISEDILQKSGEALK